MSKNKIKESSKLRPVDIIAILLICMSVLFWIIRANCAAEISIITFAMLGFYYGYDVFKRIKRKIKKSGRKENER